MNRSAHSLHFSSPLLILLLILPIALAAQANDPPDETPSASGSERALIAERITQANFATRHVGGPDSDAGVGDWFLSNGTICAAISDPEHESPMAPKGGVLLDLGHCGRNDDQWAVLQPMLNLSQSHVVPVTDLEAGTTNGEAWIRTQALFAGVEITTTYSLSLSEPTALRVQTEAMRVADGDRLFTLGTIMLHTSGQTRPFSLLRGDPEASLGFAYPASDRGSLFSLIGALVPADVNILVGSEGMPPISYGLEQLGASITFDQEEERPLRTFAVTGLHFTAFSTLSQPSWFGSATDAPSLLDLARIPFIDLDRKEHIRSEFRIWVGERSDVASITDQLWARKVHVQGRIDEPDALIHIETEAGSPITVVRPEASGKFVFWIPAGHYRARVRGSAGRSSEFAFDVPLQTDRPSKTQALPPVQLGAPAWIQLPKDFLGRLIFLDTETNEPLVLGDDLLGFKIGDEAVASAHQAPFLNLAGVAEDPRRIPVPAGQYRVLAVRGPEYEIREIGIETIAGQQTELVVPTLKRIAQTPGWIAADLHVHSGQSFDSGLPATRQIAAFAASGAEVLVATEHDRIVDPAPAFESTGLSRELVIVNGVEVTSVFEGGDSPYSAGHWNAFPMLADPSAYRGGAPTLEGRRARDAISDIRALETQPFLQLNHPRPGVNEGEGDTYFAHLSVVGEPYDPTIALTSAPNSALIERSSEHGLRDVDYDGVELLNGPDLVRYRRVRADWFSLLLQGESRVATSNSDSHRLGVIVGLPRTYVRLAGDSVADFDERAFVASLGHGHAYGTTGPLLEMRLGKADIGDLYSANKGLLQIKVDAAPWVPIAEWRAYVNGELVHRAPISAGESAQLPLAFERDAFVTVEVQGPSEGTYHEALPGFTPFAFTNPIFVDVDGNGRFDAPGLPESLPQSLTDPDRPD